MTVISLYLNSLWQLVQLHYYKCIYLRPQTEVDLDVAFMSSHIFESLTASDFSIIK